MTATEQYISVLTDLKQGDLSLLRQFSHKTLEQSVEGFDLFAGLWWPLRQRNQRAPRRQVAWLIAKLYAFCPLEHAPGAYFAKQMGLCKPYETQALHRHTKRFNQLLVSPLEHLEVPLQWGLKWLENAKSQVDWVRLTDQLSIWEREQTRLDWAQLYLTAIERRR